MIFCCPGNFNDNWCFLNFLALQARQLCVQFVLLFTASTWWWLSGLWIGLVLWNLGSGDGNIVINIFSMFLYLPIDSLHFLRRWDNLLSISLFLQLNWCCFQAESFACKVNIGLTISGYVQKFQSAMSQYYIFFLFSNLPV